MKNTLMSSKYHKFNLDQKDQAQVFKDLQRKKREEREKRKKT